jgi:hypothetical protein
MNIAVLACKNINCSTTEMGVYGPAGVVGLLARHSIRGPGSPPSVDDIIRCSTLRLFIVVRDGGSAGLCAYSVTTLCYAYG